jgi:hypothetical protein
MYKGIFHQPKRLDNDTKQVFKPHSLAPKKYGPAPSPDLCEPAMVRKQRIESKRAYNQNMRC